MVEIKYRTTKMTFARIRDWSVRGEKSTGVVCEFVSVPRRKMDGPQEIDSLDCTSSGPSFSPISGSARGRFPFVCSAIGPIVNRFNQRAGG